MYVCSQSQHAHTKHIEYDAHLPFLQEVSALEAYDVEKDPCFSKKEESRDPLPAAEDQVPRDLAGQPPQRLHWECPVRTPATNQYMQMEGFTIKTFEPNDLKISFFKNKIFREKNKRFNHYKKIKC